MKRTDSMPFARKIRLRIWGCWAAIVVMTVYMLVLVEIGGGDSRIMTRTAELVTRLLQRPSSMSFWVMCSLLVETRWTY